jgi:2-dehydro-3-deoxyphosphogluconate aldolase/(4S)-4-hydroxy-2-oxoglutarate aldolase
LSIEALLEQHRIIPVLTQDDPDVALKIAEALAEGGLHCIEVALRTPNALRVIEALRRQLPELCIGAGTLRRPSDFAKVQNAGAQFTVSPGATQVFLDEAKNWDLPYLPAAATVSEIMRLQDCGYPVVKIFPAGQLGGINYLKSLSAPLPNIRFVPSGGVDIGNLQGYLDLEQVAAVSGSWMVPSDAVKTGDWAILTELASSASSLTLHQ